jgi:hypothetical protein
LRKPRLFRPFIIRAHVPGMARNHAAAKKRHDPHADPNPPENPQ